LDIVGVVTQPVFDEPTAVLPVPPSRGRRHWPLIVVGGVLAVALLGGAGWALLDRSTPAASTSVAKASPHPSESAHRTRGTIIAETAGAWTIRTASGRTVTVAITARTAFGTAKHPATAEDFRVGTTVAVTGPVNHDSVSATRITAVATAPPSASPTRSA